MTAPSQIVSPMGLIGADEGPRLRLGPLEILIKEDGSGTRGNLSVGEFRGYTFKIPPHTHTAHDENIYVLEGELRVQMGADTWVATAGSSFTIPVGVAHSLSSDTGRLVRFLNVIVPGKYIEYFRELAAAASGNALPPIDEIKRVMARYGLVPVVPPTLVEKK